MKFADEAKRVLDDHLDSTDYQVGDVVKSFYSSCKEFAEKLGDKEITKVCVFFAKIMPANLDRSQRNR
jgi:hypothetical protein